LALAESCGAVIAKHPAGWPISAFRRVEWLDEPESRLEAGSGSSSQPPFDKEKK
jgi:hypothetical protein